MRILFGVQTTGNGHISRSREIVRELKRLGNDVRTVLSGRDPGELREVEIFEPWESFRGLTFASGGGKVKLLNTLRKAPFYTVRMWRDVASFDSRGADVVVCDFEPITARVARRDKIPCIGVGHQYAFVFDVPTIRSDPGSRYILSHMAPAKIPLGLHWHHFGHPILPPIVPDDMEFRSAVGNKILVYLPFEDNSDIVRTLRAQTQFDFFIYGTNQPEGDSGHLHHRGYSRGGFLADLTDCAGVICNAGFELPSEALHLGKRLLVKPLRGQLEQGSNALALAQLGLGTTMPRLDEGVVDGWLRHPVTVPPMKYPRTAAEMARWINDGNWSDPQELSARLWKDVPIAP